MNKNVFCAECGTTVGVHFHPELCVELCEACAENAEEQEEEIQNERYLP
jgi:dihydrodipicolinate synthase/N-acetylneuraminate lyase